MKLEQDDQEQILQLCKVLRLHKIADVLGEELALAASKGSAPQEVVRRLLQSQWGFVQERSLKYRVDHADVPEVWEIETFPFDKQPGVHAHQIRQLGSLDFIASGTNVVFTGDTGVGKTGLATGLLLRALRAGHRGLFVKAQDLFDEMYASLADRSTRRYIDHLERHAVILIDELGYLNLRPEQANIFFRLMEARHLAKRPTLITTNLSYDEWPGLLGNPAMTKALLSRLRQRCVTLEISGPSLRAPSQAAA